MSLKIRRAIGYLILTAAALLFLIIIHAIPELLTDWILGL